MEWGDSKIRRQWHRNMLPYFPYKINRPPTLPFSPLTRSIPPPGYRQARLTNHNLHTGNGVTTAKTGTACSLKPLPSAEVTEQRSMCY